MVRIHCRARFAVLPLVMILGVACSPEPRTPAVESPIPAAPTAAPADAALEDTLARARMAQRLAAIQTELGQLNQTIAEFRTEQATRLGRVIDQSAKLNAEVASLSAELNQPVAPATVAPPAAAVAPVATPAPLAPAPMAPVHAVPAPGPRTGPAEPATSHLFVRFILILISLGAIWFMYRKFMGRWTQAEDEDEDDEDEPGDEVFTTPEGSVRLSPEVRAAARPEPDATPAASEPLVSDAEPIQPKPPRDPR